MDHSINEDPKIPYRFMPMPHELLTEDFLKDPIMIRFLVCMMRRVSPYPKSIPLKNRSKQLNLEPFEFMFGREKFAEDAGISKKNAYTRLKQLVGLGYVVEIITKKDSNYSIYRLVKEAFHQIDGQHDGQMVEQKNGQPNGHKRETEIKENRAVKGTIVDSYLLLSEDQKEDLICIRAICENHLLQIYDKSISRWLSKYSSTHICDHLSLLIEGKDKIKKHEAWIEKALSENYVQKNKNIQANRNYIQKFLEDHKWHDLKITKAYCVHLPSGKDYRFDLPPENFQRMISECFELHKK